MAANMEDFWAAITAQQFSSILTHCTPVFVWVVLFARCARLVVGVYTGGAVPLKAM